MPKVSIIIPTFNSEKYLQECLDSAVNQTLRDIEIIVVDSCSKDRTLEILQEYSKQDSRIKIINRPKEYVGLSRNAGIEAAAGEYIMFLDSDDWLELDACEILYNKIKMDQCDFTMFGYDKKDGVQYIKKTWSFENIFKIIGENVATFDKTANYLARDSMEPWKKIYNRQYLLENKIIFDTSSFGEDVLFYWLNIIAVRKFSLCHKYLYHYRLCDNNVGTSSISTRYKDNYKVFYNAENLIEKSSRKKYYIEPFVLAWVYNICHWIERLDKNEKDYNRCMKQTFIYLNKKYDMKKILDAKKYEFFIGVIEGSYIYKNVLKNIFSVKNSPARTHKIITILGMRIKLRIKDTKKCQKFQ